MTIQDKNVPALRFPEFDDEWKKESINDLVNSKILEKPLDGNHGNIHPKSSDYVKSGIPFVMANDVYDGRVNLDNAKKITKILADKLQKGFSKTGDVLLTHKGTVGETAIVPDLETEYIMLTPQVTYYRIKDRNSLNNFFLKLTFESPSFQKDIQTLADSGTRPYIGITEQRSLKLAFPTLPEQQKIAAFLTAVDEKIQQLAGKKDFLEQYKKGVMQKIFNQEIRFKDDNGNDFADWEEKKLGEVSKFSKGKGISKSDISGDGNLECIRYGQLYTHYKETISEVISRTNVDKSKLVLSEYNDVIIPSSGETQLDIATASCVLKTGVALGGDLNIIKSKMNGVFLSYYLNNKKKLDIANLAQGISVVHLYSSQLATLKIDVPCNEEQNKIANFLSAIDEKINLVNQQLEKTRSYKEGLLQQMFV